MQRKSEIIFLDLKHLKGAICFVNRLNLFYSLATFNGCLASLPDQTILLLTILTLFPEQKGESMKTIPYFILSISVVLLLASFGYSQDKLRTIDETNYVHPNVPIEIVSHSLKGKNFSRGEKVLAGQDWLKDLKLTVKNTSPKTIVYFYIELVIPKSKNLTNRVPIPLRFGTPLFIFSDDGEATYIEKKNRELLRPGETVTVSVKENVLKAFTQSLQKRDAENFDSVKIDIQDVNFEDFSGWSVGNEWQRDSSGKKISEQKSEKSKIPQQPLYFNWLTSFLKIEAISPLTKILTSFNSSQENFFLNNSKATSAQTGCVWFTEPFRRGCHNSSDSCGDSEPEGVVCVKDWHTFGTFSGEKNLYTLRWSRKSGVKTLFASSIFSFQFQLKFERAFVAQTRM